MINIEIPEIFNNFKIKLRSYGEFPINCEGQVRAAKGQLLYAQIPRAVIGDVCEVTLRHGGSTLAQVVSFGEDFACLSPYEGINGIYPGARVQLRGASSFVRFPENPLGGVFDPLGIILDEPLLKNSSSNTCLLNLFAKSPNPLERKPITNIFETGVSVIDSLVTLGEGQRVALVAPAGVGKSTLLGMIARNSSADIVIAALVGERGREVNEFKDMLFQSDNRSKSIIVCATSDESPARRMLAPYTATAVAEYYRSKGRRVLLLIDSLTRYARALREISLAAGELPVRNGYTPSVYVELPKLLERTGNDSNGSITAIYTLLDDNSLAGDPLVNEVQSLLDGHIVLSSSKAESGLRPAVDPLKSLSRLALRLQSDSHSHTSKCIRKILSRIENDRDFVLMGGAPDPELESALKIEKAINTVLSQGLTEAPSLQDTLDEINRILARSQLPD